MVKGAGSRARTRGPGSAHGLASGRFYEPLFIQSGFVCGTGGAMSRGFPEATSEGRSGRSPQDPRVAHLSYFLTGTSCSKGVCWISMLTRSLKVGFHRVCGGLRTVHGLSAPK